jgi:hypothetical protein
MVKFTSKQKHTEIILVKEMLNKKDGNLEVNMVVTNDKNIRKKCSFYVSDFHLEMIILPYITEKMEENKDIKIITQSNLEESMKTLLSKTNIKNKNDILKIDWDNSSIDEINDNAVIIINGTEEFIKQKNEEIRDSNKKVEIVNCFKFEEIKDRIKEIADEYEEVINNLK